MKLTRSAAQSYCRAHFVDLATFKTEEDWEAVRELAERTTFWIGLYQDRRAWKWSLDNTYLYGDDGNIAYGDWFVFQINHYWNSQPNNKYIPVTVPMTWSSAQSYCREKYTDLTSMRNQQEKEEILKVTDESTWWIGVYRKLWNWPDRSISSLALWNNGEPNGGASEPKTGRKLRVTVGRILVTWQPLSLKRNGKEGTKYLKSLQEHMYG
ncbi:hypothetical protein F7725_024776 [Dissostichus mawsoni]|uniref:C-type lectin domain-containing protein n=1 Tax=Dissostichus mawsoni TaxID=36200 RepID=A0A7J5X9A7_DISMA|nr:hypothetical protein F7725_024776 [Dissostichus mawsoni]